MEIRAHASSLGIDEPFISELVDQFYAKVRVDPVLGPIFSKRVGSDWTPHLVTMKQFWSSVALSTGDYSGKPVPVHQKLTEIERADFEHWLNLFEETLHELAQGPDAISYFMERARRIAESLKLALFSLPSLQKPRGEV